MGFSCFVLNLASFIILATLVRSQSSSSSSTAAPGQAVPYNSILSCFACGLEEIDPNKDVPGSYGDGRKPNTPSGKKMYNNTCDIADSMGLDSKWLRPCPEGVRSCFWAQARYDNQVPLFRGCAGAKFAYDEGCSRELQAVDVSVGQYSVDVEINLCYCNSDSCNKDKTSASGRRPPPGLPCLILLAIIWLLNPLFRQG